MPYEWMGRYRRLVSAIVTQGNEYAKQQNLRREIAKGLFLSTQEWQILEYTVEHVGSSGNMNSIAESLSIPQSSFSKAVKLLCDLDLIEKYQSTRNKKNIILKPTEYAQQVYEENSKKLRSQLFGGFFQALDGVDDEHLELFTQAMEILYKGLVEDGRQVPEPEILVKKDAAKKE